MSTRKRWIIRELSSLVWEERGQDLIEYALLVAVVAITGGAAISPLTPHISTIYSKIVSCLAKHQ